MTEFSRHITTAIPATKAPAIATALTTEARPAGERFFNPDRPTHVDADGGEWIVISTSVRPTMLPILDALTTAFPDARFAVDGHLADDEGQPAHWRAGGVCMEDTGEGTAVMEGLTRVADDPDETDDQINVNAAPSEDLQTLDGVGPTLADRIIDDRPYSTVDDLTRVQGVSQEMVDGWGDEVTV